MAVSYAKEAAKYLKNYVTTQNLRGSGKYWLILWYVLYMIVLPNYLRENWPTQFLESFPKKPLLFWSIVLSGLFYLFLTEGIFLVIYKLNHPFFEQFKISPKPWPWQSDPKAWHELLWKSIYNIAGFQFVMMPILTYLNVYHMDGDQMPIDKASFPSNWTLTKQFLFMIMTEDFTFYWTHRLMHVPWIYKIVHKQHHEYHDGVSIASQYAHPVEQLLGGLIPSASGMIILGNRVHYATSLLWVFYRVVKSTDAHCGYEFPWMPFHAMPFYPTAEFHNFHHTHNVGNYGTFMFWDTLMKTNPGFMKDFHRISEKERAKLD